MEKMHSCLYTSLLALLMHPITAAFSPPQVLPLRSTAYGTAFTALVAFGNQTHSLLLDTRSSDLWVLDSNWKCFEQAETAGTNYLGRETTRDACLYGNGTYTRSPSYNLNNDSWLGVHYGAGDIIGTMGTEDVRLGELLLSDQPFGAAFAVTGTSDGYSEGIMGLGYPILSQTHPEDYVAQSPFDLLRDTLEIQTVVLSLTEQLEEPYFAFAVERVPRDQEQADGGYVSFGTLPPVQYEDDWTILPVETTETVPIALTGNISQHTYWTTTVESVSWNNETYDTAYQAVVDTGNFYFVVPEQLAEQVASAFDPPGVYEADGPLGPIYSVECDAALPSNVSITLGGTTFEIDSEDLIYRDEEGGCFSTFAPTVPLEGIDLFFLGSHFLRNVVAVFDYPNDQMRVAQRIANDTAADGEPTAHEQSENGADTFGRGPLALFTVLLAIAVLM